jgi:hypothetical protein
MEQTAQKCERLLFYSGRALNPKEIMFLEHVLLALGKWTSKTSTETKERCQNEAVNPRSGYS